ncbi:MAG TPA: hypothetical protein VFQ90_04215 [Stellaceae bacterium]|jgi:hypothetical protein|nr:hypothetical protein [Stellaceae bacterium]
MRSTLLAATAIAASLALPLATYAAPNTATMNPTGNATGATSAAPNNNNTNGAASTTNPTNNNETANNNNNNATPRRMARSGAPQGSMIRAHLRRAGFSNIRIRPTAFVASATDRHGRPVLMAFRPHSFQAITLTNAGRSRSSAAGQNGAQ